MALETGFRPTPITTKSAPAQISEQLRSAIATGALRPGERLPAEVELAQTFGVSRGTVREAMRILAAGGLIVSTRGGAGGTFVTMPSPEQSISEIGDLLALWLRAGDVSLTEIRDARRVLELECVRLAARNRGTEDLAAIRSAVEESREPTIDIDEFLAIDIEFHTAISRAAKNRVLELAMSAVHLVRPTNNALILDALDHARVADQHWEMYLAIEIQDPDRAKKAFSAHDDYLSQVVAGVLAGRDSTEVILGGISMEPHPPSTALRRHRPGHRAGEEPSTGG